MFKLVFIDLDNTLLNKSGTVTPRSRAAISALVLRGIRVVLASGRPPRMVRQFQIALNLEGPSICYNGALVSASPSGGVLWERRIPGQAALVILDILRQAKVANILCECEDCLTGEIEEELLTRAVKEEWGFRADVPLAEMVKAGAHKLLAICPRKDHPELAKRLRHTLPGQIDFITSESGTSWLEILSAGTSKVVAAIEVGRLFSLDLAQAAAFGDGENDAALLARVGLGIAMANGDPRAKAAAKRVAPSNDEDGVAQVVEELLAVG